MLNKFKNMTLSQKVSTSFVLMGMVLMLFLVGVYWQNWLYKTSYDALNEQSTRRTFFKMKEVELQNDLSAIFNETLFLTKTFEPSDKPKKLLQKYINDLVDFKKILVLQTSFSEQIFQIEIQIKNLNKLLNLNDPTSNEFIYLKQAQIEIYEMFAEIDQIQLKELTQQSAQIDASATQNLRVSLVFLILCLALIIYLILKTTRQIHVTIKQLIDFTENVSRGQINHRLDAKGNTDLGFLIAAFNNMTENLSMASEILDERDQLKDEFVSVVSHEIRTPIAILQRVIENMRSGVAGVMTTEQESLIKIAENNVLRLSHLIKNLLDMARLESRQMKMQPTTVNLREILQDLNFGFDELAKKENLNLVIKVDPALPNNFADSELIIQVITNLFNNALRFAKSQIVIEAKVQTLRGKPAIQVSLKDDGPGISLENQKKLFQKFVQINRQSTGQGYKGTGLGLAICKQIVEQHGGTIDVSSKPPHGTEFFFILPQK